jgi:hypothetical protein
LGWGTKMPGYSYGNELAENNQWVFLQACYPYKKTSRTTNLSGLQKLRFVFGMTTSNTDNCTRAKNLEQELTLGGLCPIPLLKTGVFYQNFIN